MQKSKSFRRPPADRSFEFGHHLTSLSTYAVVSISTTHFLCAEKARLLVPEVLQMWIRHVILPDIYSSELVSMTPRPRTLQTSSLHCIVLLVSLSRGLLANNFRSVLHFLLPYSHGLGMLKAGLTGKNSERCASVFNASWTPTGLWATTCSRVSCNSHQGTYR